MVPGLEFDQHPVGFTTCSHFVFYVSFNNLCDAYHWNWFCYNKRQFFPQILIIDTPYLHLVGDYWGFYHEYFVGNSLWYKGIQQYISITWYDIFPCVWLILRVPRHHSSYFVVVPDFEFVQLPVGLITVHMCFTLALIYYCCVFCC